MSLACSAEFVPFLIAEVVRFVPRDPSNTSFLREPSARLLYPCSFSSGRTANHMFWPLLEPFPRRSWFLRPIRAHPFSLTGRAYSLSAHGRFGGTRVVYVGEWWPHSWA